jgi:hypothetical protein
MTAVVLIENPFWFVIIGVLAVAIWMPIAGWLARRPAKPTLPAERQQEILNRYLKRPKP